VRLGGRGGCGWAVGGHGWAWVGVVFGESLLIKTLPFSFLNLLKFFNQFNSQYA